NLVDIASKGGNYLLNVGPTAEGVIPEPSVERLAAVGKWMKVSGDAIYGTTASPFSKPLDFGRATVKGNRLYLHVFNWPKDGKLQVPHWKNLKRAYMLASPSTRLKFSGTGGVTTIDVPAVPPDAVASVVVLESGE
ncbi:MAG: alpha-L-fucosidase, partial [Blastocatellia bacterium]